MRWINLFRHIGRIPQLTLLWSGKCCGLLLALLHWISCFLIYGQFCRKVSAMKLPQDNAFIWAMYWNGFPLGTFHRTVSVTFWQVLPRNYLLWNYRAWKWWMSSSMDTQSLLPSFYAWSSSALLRRLFPLSALLFRRWLCRGLADTVKKPLQQPIKQWKICPAQRLNTSGGFPLWSPLDRKVLLLRIFVMPVRNWKIFTSR